MTSQHDPPVPPHRKTAALIQYADRRQLVRELRGMLDVLEDDVNPAILIPAPQ